VTQVPRVSAEVVVGICQSLSKGPVNQNGIGINLPTARSRKNTRHNFSSFVCPAVLKSQPLRRTWRIVLYLIMNQALRLVIFLVLAFGSVDGKCRGWSKTVRKRLRQNVPPSLSTESLVAVQTDRNASRSASDVNSRAII